MTKPETVTPAELAALAQRLHLSTPALAAYLGAPVPTVIKWQNGTRRPPAVAARLLAVLATVEALAPDLHRAALMPAPAVKAARRAPTAPAPAPAGSGEAQG